MCEILQEAPGTSDVLCVTLSIYWLLSGGADLCAGPCELRQGPVMSTPCRENEVSQLKLKKIHVCFVFLCSGWGRCRGEAEGLGDRGPQYNGVRAAWMNVCISEQRDGEEDKEGYAWVSGG